MRLPLVLFLALASFCASCASSDDNGLGLHLPVPKSASGGKPATFDLSDPRQVDELTGKLTEKRALFIGEIHDRQEHHQNQLLLIQNLYERYPYIAIGVEYFQQPFQSHLNDYIAGYIDEREMLVRTEYFKRWNIDYRMLQPILRFAREKHIPLLALNISDEIHHKVFHGGIKSLTPQDREHIPDDIQPIGRDYKERLKAIFNAHPEGNTFEMFVEGQQLWDETMADAAAKYLNQHPQTMLVVLAGLGHMMYGDGIPKALDRRLGGKYSAVAINGKQLGEYHGIADFILASSGGTALPDAGKLGISVDDSSRDVVITQLGSKGAARDSGINAGDRLLALDGIKVANFPEIKSIMFDKRPGDVVRVTVRREHLLDKDEELQFDVTLR
ncbi:MAG: ChaN family lipoprotein [Pseudomonadota bacterium]